MFHKIQCKECLGKLNDKYFIVKWKVSGHSDDCKLIHPRVRDDKYKEMFSLSNAFFHYYDDESYDLFHDMKDLAP